MADVGKPGCLVFGRHRRRALVQDPDALLLLSHLPPDNVAIVKHVIVVLVLVFVVQAQAEVSNDSKQGRSGALLWRCTRHRQQWRGGGGDRGVAHGNIFIAAGVIVPSISGGGSGNVHCCPCHRGKDACVVTVIAGVVVNVNRTAIAVAAAIVIFVVLTAAVTIAIAAAAAQPLLLLSILVDCCLLEVIKSLDVDVIEGLAKSPLEQREQDNDVIDINNSISGTRGVDDVDNDNDDDDNNTINDDGGTAITEHQRLRQGQLRRFGNNSGNDGNCGEGDCNGCSDDKEGDMVTKQ